MITLSADTTPEAERILIELMRKAPPWRKLCLMAQMNESLRLLTTSGLRQRYPQASYNELRRRLASLCLGPVLATRVYGELSKEETAPC